MAIARRSRQDEPVIVMGDLNVTEQDAVVKYLTGEGAIDDRSSPVTLVDAFRALNTDAEETGTYNGFRYGLTRGPRIDYILVDETAVVEAVEIIRDHQDERYPSDHFPVTAVLRWGADASQDAETNAGHDEPAAAP